MSLTLFNYQCIEKLFKSLLLKFVNPSPYFSPHNLRQITAQIPLKLMISLIISHQSLQNTKIRLQYKFVGPKCCLLYVQMALFARQTLPKNDDYTHLNESLLAYYTDHYQASQQRFSISSRPQLSEYNHFPLFQMFLQISSIAGQFLISEKPFIKFSVAIQRFENKSVQKVGISILSVCQQMLFFCISNGPFSDSIINGHKIKRYIKGLNMRESLCEFSLKQGNSIINGQN